MEWVKCYLCEGERFIETREGHLACPVCEMDGCVLTQLPEGPTPTFIRLIKDLIIQEYGEPMRQPKPNYRENKRKKDNYKPPSSAELESLAARLREAEIYMTTFNDKDPKNPEHYYISFADSGLWAYPQYGLLKPDKDREKMPPFLDLPHNWTLKDLVDSILRNVT